jgi:hypothetical protein
MDLFLGGGGGSWLKILTYPEQVAHCNKHDCAVTQVVQLWLLAAEGRNLVQGNPYDINGVENDTGTAPSASSLVFCLLI